MKKKSRSSWRNNAVLICLSVLFAAFVSCTSKEEKLYGKIDTKAKNEIEIIQKVQNAYFPINANILLKEAVVLNKYSENIVWGLPWTDGKGTYVVSVQYNIPSTSIWSITSSDYFDEEVVGGVNLVEVVNRTNNPLIWEDGSVLSPYGYANIVTRFIKGEIETPHTNEEGIKEEMLTLLQQYEEFVREEEYTNDVIFIPPRRIPDLLPDPFFNRLV
jgi:hypothetical protein